MAAALQPAISRSAPGDRRSFSSYTRASADSSTPASSATRRRRLWLKSSSPRIAASVIAAISALRPAASPSSSMHSIVIRVESMSIATSRRSARRSSPGIQAQSIARAAHHLPTSARFEAPRRRNAASPIGSSEEAEARREISCALSGVAPGPCTTRIMPRARAARP